MRYLPLLLITLTASAARADILASSTFDSSPVTGDPRFVLNGDGTLTAQFDTSQSTDKLLFPLTEHLNQNTSFTLTTTFKILSAGFTPSDFFTGQAPAFGLVNSASTGNLRASTADGNFTIVTDGNAYNTFTFDYFPTTDPSASSIDLSVIQSPAAGQSFDDRFVFNNSLFVNAALPLDQFITTTISYDAATQHALVDWGTGSLDADLTGAVFDVDSFAIPLWSDPQLDPTDGAFAWDAGEPVAANVVFDSFSVESVPEPASLMLLAPAALLLLKKRRR